MALPVLRRRVGIVISEKGHQDGDAVRQTLRDSGPYPMVGAGDQRDVRADHARS
jgi:hypothetical protein